MGGIVSMAAFYVRIAPEMNAFLLEGFVFGSRLLFDA